MCIHCTDFDSYESNHGHKHDEDCFMSCDICGERLCGNASDKEDPMYSIKIDSLRSCMVCYNKEFSYDSEGRYL